MQNTKKDKHFPCKSPLICYHHFPRLSLLIILIVVGLLGNVKQSKAQTALKWSAYLSDNYAIQPYTSYLDEATDRYFVAGIIKGTPGFSNSLPYSYVAEEDIAIICLSTDGTTVHWMAHFGGNGKDRPYAISTNSAGDIFIAGKTESTDFPTNGTTLPYDATIDNVLGAAFITRLSPDGSTLKYSTYIGNYTSSRYYSESLVVQGDVVYYGGAVESSGSFPVTDDAFQSTSNGDREGVLFSLNTAVDGVAGLNWATYIGGTNEDGVTSLKLGPDGELVVSGYLYSNGDGTENFPVTYNAIETPASINGMVPNNSEGQFVSKFTTEGALTYSTLLFMKPTSFSGSRQVSMDVDRDGNIYTAAMYGISGAFQAAPSNNQFTVISSPSINYINVVSKIPASLTPALEYLTVFMSNAGYEKPQIRVDNKNRAHILFHSEHAKDGHFVTAGSLPSINPSNNRTIAYGILSPSGASVEYMTNLRWGNSSETYNPTISLSNDGTAYISQDLWKNASFPATPTYYDQDAGVQKTVFNTTNSAEAVNVGGILVFHDPRPNNNAINDFTPGNNTFCINGLIYQNPNDGPILGMTPDYQSGDGSSALHNLPDLFIPEDGTTITHPGPESPQLKYQWEKSYDGTTWINIQGATLEIFKPDSEPAAATISYRRLAITGMCDTVTSNLATATIAGNFGLDINAPIASTYYCPGTAKSLGIVVSGASGNISWQWYNGFSPLTASEISPASGTNLAEGAFTASIPATATGEGAYRLIITDAGGCKKEAFVSIAPLTAPASQAGYISICPGTTPSVTIGPPSSNPNFDYSWTGPSGFTSSLSNPVVTLSGTYTLQVKLTSDATFCASGATSVIVNALIAHDAVLTTITNSEFCQADSPGPIGLTSTPPAGYTFQWVPGLNLDDVLSYNPNFDPGVIPFDLKPVSTVTYTFSALRLSDGCIFETTTIVSDTARAFAQAGLDAPACGLTPFTVLGNSQTDGNYWNWRAVSTSYPGGIAALTAHTDFGMDSSSTNLGTNKFLLAHFPSDDACYTIDYELSASYVPFPARCSTKDIVRVYYCPDCSGGSWAFDINANNSGTDGTCSGSNSVISAPTLSGLTYTWTTYSIDGIVQPANTLPQGLFEMNPDSTKGVALSGLDHSTNVIADFDDTSWGWAGANVVIYRVTAEGYFGATTINTYADVQVFSAANGTPSIVVLDQTFCTVDAPSIRLGFSGKDIPYTLAGIDYTLAPNTAFDWQWTTIKGTSGSITAGATTPFPTIAPTAPTWYHIQVNDPVTGCQATDTLFADVTPVITIAGDDINAVCSGTLVQLGANPQINHTYSWSPSAGLNYPIGTPNSTAANPYLLVSGNNSYTITTTESKTGCQATDVMNITTTISAPPTPASDGPYEACANASFTIGPSTYITEYVAFSWSALAGSANIAWLDATDVYNPTVTLPAGFSGPAVFRLTVSQGSCGSSFQDYTINDNAPNPNLGADVNYDCSMATIPLSSPFISNDFVYSWTPIEGLYGNSIGSLAYNGGYSSNLYRIYASPATTTTYTVTMRDEITGCVGTDDVIVTVPTTVAADAGADIIYCQGDGSKVITATGIGSSFIWTATGYSSDPYAVVGLPSAGEQTTMLSYLSTDNGLSISFNQSTLSSGRYEYTITASDGVCSTSDELEIIVSEIGMQNLAGKSTSVCEGASVQLGIISPPAQFTYFWQALNPISENASISDQTSPFPTVTPTVSTVYELTYADPLTGCSNTEIVTVNVTSKPNISNVEVPGQCTPLPNIDLTSFVPSYGLYFNQSWFQNSMPGTIENTPESVNPSQTTNYYLYAENSFGCPDTAVVKVNVDYLETPIVAPISFVNCPSMTADLTQEYYSMDPLLTWHTSTPATLTNLIPDPTAVNPGIYYAAFYDPDLSCYSGGDGSATASVEVVSFCSTICRTAITNPHIMYMLNRGK